MIETPIIERENGRVSARVHGPGYEETLWFQSPQSFTENLTQLGEAFSASVLFVAMKEGWSLRLLAPVSGQFLNSLTELQQIYACWFPEFTAVEFTPEAVIEDSTSPAEGVMFCFSGGLDSFHTYVENREQITHGLTVFGADIGLEEKDFRSYLIERHKNAAREMGIELVVVDTNLLDVTGEHCEWAKHLHGAGLSAIAKLFGQQIRTLFIASSYPVNKLLPWGSHPFTDPMWAGADVNVIHYGAYLRRIDKVARVSENDLALRHLRVCFGNQPGSLNCGECEKCLRTMAALQAVDRLESCPTFRRPLDLKAVASMPYGSNSSRRDWRGTLDLLEETGAHTELAAAIRHQAAENRAAFVDREFWQHHQEILASERWATKLPQRRNKLIKSLKTHDSAWFEESLRREISESPDIAFAALWRNHRKWLKQKFKQAEAARFRQRLQSALRRLGIGGTKKSKRLTPP